ncbi:MAG: glycosyltransferase family 2 protein [Blastocatellia bacterium]|nr:glycosyltransferase family 2 protein [Blastocatellia bacterium]
MTLQQGVSIVIPVYNSAAILPDVVERLHPVLAGMGQPFEVIFVNDGSRDASWQVLTELAAKRDWVKSINLMRNYGQHNALLCGIRQASYALLVTMDDDLQHPPEEIPKLFAHLGDADVVYGTPQAEQHGLWRDLASQITKLALQSAMGVNVARNVSAFRLFRTQVRDAFINYQGPFVSIDVLLTWGTTRFTSVAVNHQPREIGVSNYTFRKLVVHALNMMTGFSVLPLQIASVIGFGCTLFGLVVLAYVIGRYLIQGSVVQGFPFLASIISIFSGAQLLSIGIIGEYLARMHFRMMDRPAYITRTIVSQKQP